MTAADLADRHRIVFVGWPLPESIPTLTSITEGARRGVPDEVLINTLAIVGWLAWMQLALTVIIEGSPCCAR